LYDSIKKIRKELKKKSIKTVSKNLRLGYQVFFFHRIPNYYSQKYISYKKYSPFYFSKKKRVKRRYLHKYFKKKLKNRRFNIKKKIILKYRGYTKIKNFDTFLVNKKRKKLLNGKKLLKYKLSFFKYYFSKYITNSFIVFRNIKKINSNVKRLFKKYYNFF